MVSLENTHPQTRPYYYLPRPSKKFQRPPGRSMRTIRSNIFQTNYSSSLPGPTATNNNTTNVSENLATDSVINLRLNQLDISLTEKSAKPSEDHFLNLSQAFTTFSVCSSDISRELQRLATLPSSQNPPNPDPNTEPCFELFQRVGFLTEIIESISPEDLKPTVKLCIDGLNSPSTAVKRSAAAKLRLLAKNRSDYRALIGSLGAIPALVPLLKSNDPWTQEHAVTALLNLSLHDDNKTMISNSGAIKPLVYVLKTGTWTSKQNAACALLSLALVEKNKVSIGASGAIPPLVTLLINGSNRGKKDSITALYRLCSVKVNKERAVRAGAVRVLVGLVGESGTTGLAEKAMVVLSSLAGVRMGREKIVEEGGVGKLVEVVENGGGGGGLGKGKEFAVMALLRLCRDSVRHRGLVVKEGGIPPLVTLSETGSAKAKLKVETLLGYLREESRDKKIAVEVLS